MDTQAAEFTIKAYLREVRARLDKAAGIARAADAAPAPASAIRRSRSHSISSNRFTKRPRC